MNNITVKAVDLCRVTVVESGHTCDVVRCTVLANIKFTSIWIRF